MLAIMEVLESRISREVALRLLQIVNTVGSSTFIVTIRTSLESTVGNFGHGFPGEFLLDWVCIKYSKRLSGD